MKTASPGGDDRQDWLLMSLALTLKPIGLRAASGHVRFRYGYGSINEPFDTYPIQMQT